MAGSGALLLENLAGIMIGILAGGLVLLARGELFDFSSLPGLLCSAVLLAC